ncbi:MULTISPECIES: DUF6049 family protein [unclassified Streptomyces]|uniref:DUF6049 family protein n=1 Tax=unclassified Streptomyces TaxID=2593676 RepID=UPI000DBA632F|nr:MULTISPECIES: DUF6049 family protein [unclassified Streptomyces]MYT70065.1 hypothetical protein [Streptomyces sp. SID8367]RAJ88638.1 hypothetical protein K377_02094 [Streptomyces sp. PsTaAH-137]
MARFGAARAWVVSAMVLGASTSGVAAHAAEDDGTDAGHAAVVWPVTATPHMTAAALGSGDDARPVFDSDELADLFADGGRLREVVDAGKGRDVNWVLDPDLVLAAQAMARGYRVADSADSSNPQDSTQGTGQSAAREWLADLKGAVRGRDVWLLPYADTDLASLAHHPSADTDDLTEVVANLAEDAKRDVDSILGTGTRSGLGWPADGALDTRITALAGKLDVTWMLASGQGLTPAGDDPVTLGEGDDAITALPYDTGVTTALSRIEDEEKDTSSASPSPSASPSAVAGIPSTGTPSPSGSDASPSGSPSPSASEKPDTPDQKTVDRVTALLKANTRPVVVPPRELSGTAANALAAAIDSGTDDGWLEPEGIRTADNDPVTGQAGASSGYPSRLRASELTAGQLGHVAADLDGLATLSKVLADPKVTAASVHAAMARALSTAWRAHDDADQETFQQRTRAFLDTSVDSLRMVPKSTVTVTSGDATIPVTVDNGLQQPVAGLELRVTSSDAERLRINDATLAVEAAGSASHTNQLSVTAKANGKAQLTARLYTTSDGKPWGDPMTFEVDVASVSTGAITVVGVGVALIVLAAAVRMHNVRRRRAREAPADGQD